MNLEHREVGSGVGVRAPAVVEVPNLHGGRGCARPESPAGLALGERAKRNADRGRQKLRAADGANEAQKILPELSA